MSRYKRVSDAEIVESICQVTSVHGYVTQSRWNREIRQAQPSLLHAITIAKRLGGWQRAWELAGAKATRAHGVRSTMSDAEMIEVIRQVATTHGYVSRIRWTQEIKKIQPHYPHAHTIIQRFGSWQRAWELADVNLSAMRGRNVHGIFPAEAIAAKMREIAAQGVMYHISQWDREVAGPLPVGQTILKHYGGWRAAWEAAGLDVSQLMYPSRATIRAEILATMREKGDCQHRDIPHAGMVKVCFGSWSAAWEEAGIQRHKLPVDPSTLPGFLELSLRDQEILSRRYQGAKLDTIGSSLGITRERVRQIVAKQMAWLLTPETERPIPPELQPSREKRRLGFADRFCSRKL